AQRRVETQPAEQRCRLALKLLDALLARELQLARGAERGKASAVGRLPTDGVRKARRPEQPLGALRWRRNRDHQHGVAGGRVVERLLEKGAPQGDGADPIVGIESTERAQARACGGTHGLTSATKRQQAPSASCRNSTTLKPTSASNLQN